MRGLDASGPVTVIAVQPTSEDSANVVYQLPAGEFRSRLVFATDLAFIELVAEATPWTFQATGADFRLGLEAYRIRRAPSFDPFLAVRGARVEPLPHQLTAVYEAMLPRTPLRFLLADDPGAGKTIMTGLLIKELELRGDLARCLIVAPGALVEQWQEELRSKFDLSFTLLTRASVEAAASGNVFQESPRLIARLDMLARDEQLQGLLTQTEWDLVVCDEAHKLSASYAGIEIKYTKRFKLAQLLTEHSRHFLLLTATPHNGHDVDFHLFLSLLDPDRFTGNSERSQHNPTPQVSDLMRRMVKEQLVKFDGTPLFPERFATTVAYSLSAPEQHLYEAVTAYVRTEFNRAESAAGFRRNTIGFALTVLQRRLASSPAAIYQSLTRRRKRLEALLEAATHRHAVLTDSYSAYDDEYLNDLDEGLADDVETEESSLADQTTAANTIAELRAELATLANLEAQAAAVRRSGQDRKWDELSRLLQDDERLFTTGPGSARRKLVIFTEHRDTLTYLHQRIATLLTDGESAIALIHGGMRREERIVQERSFNFDPRIRLLIATDAAGEGINLQWASHLMVNYDLPWNPNRLEQRFGRIHRIGQQEVCFLWNLVAQGTREGDVYVTLLNKLETEREALGGAVFDILGQAIANESLRDLLIKAVRYGDDPDVRRRLQQQVATDLDRGRLEELLRDRALATESLGVVDLQKLRDEMARAEARRLQPHHLGTFFRAAFARLNGTIYPREGSRYEIRHVPQAVRQRATARNPREPLTERYHRVCFDKSEIKRPSDQPPAPPAVLVAPGHPLHEAVLDLTLSQLTNALNTGALMVDERPTAPAAPRVLFALEFQLETRPAAGPVNVVRHCLEFVEVELSELGTIRTAGPAPHLDYRPLDPDAEAVRLLTELLPPDSTIVAAEAAARAHVAAQCVPAELAETRAVHVPRIRAVRAAVQERLTREIAYWDARYAELAAREAAGRANQHINSPKARQRAEDLEARLARRMQELQQEEELVAAAPTVRTAALIVPQSLLPRVVPDQPAVSPSTIAPPTFAASPEARRRVEQAAMTRVMTAERTLGHEPADVSARKCGYDIESRLPNGTLRQIEVKGRMAGAEAVFVTRNEIITALNRAETWRLALVEVPAGDANGDSVEVLPVRYVRQPFRHEPEFHTIHVALEWAALWAEGQEPSASA